MQSQRTKCKPVSLCPEMHIQTNKVIIGACKLKCVSQVPPSPISITSPLPEEEEIQTINSTPQANKTVTPPPVKKINHKHQLNRTLCEVCQNSGCIKNAFLQIEQIPHYMLLKCPFVLNLFSILDNVNKRQTNQHFPFLSSHVAEDNKPL